MIEEFSKDLLANQNKGYLVYGEESDDSEDILSSFIGFGGGSRKIVLLANVTCDLLAIVLWTS